MNQTIAPTLVAAQAQSAQTPVFDLLARSWTLEAGITDVAMDPAGKVAGFALTDGRVALMSLDDADSPFSRMRVEADSGRSTIRPREKPVAAPILTAKLAEGAPFLTPSKMIGLIVAAPDGRIHRVTPRGQVIVLNSTPGPVFAVASDGLGHLAIARDGRTDLLEETGMTRLASLLTAGPATALAFAPVTLVSFSISVSIARSSSIKVFFNFCAPSTSTLTPLNLMSTRHGNRSVSRSKIDCVSCAVISFFISCHKPNVASASRSA